MNAKLFPWLAAAALLTGCAQPITNLTQAQAPQNDSGIYPLTMNARLDSGSYVAGTLQAFVVIDGAEHAMKPANVGDQIFEYEYALPAGQVGAKYYYELKYKTEDKSGITRDGQTDSTTVYTLNVVNRYVITMEAARGRVGATVAVVGHGFQPLDTVAIGGQSAPTTYQSPNSLTFEVPALPAGHQYGVELHSGTSVTPLGLFRVDVSNMTVTPDSLALAQGDSAQLLFDIGRNAPEGGVPVTVLTNIPASVIMGEVVVPGGSRTVNARVKGGEPGAGKLHISAPGFNDVEVPIIVGPASEKAAEPAPAPEPAPAATPPPAAAAEVKMGS